MPDIKFNCPRCGQHISIDEAGRGCQVDCPSCQRGIVVPDSPIRMTKTPLWRLWVGITCLVVVALAAAGVLLGSRLSKSQASENTARNQTSNVKKAAIQIPVRIEQDGVYLTHDSILNLGSTPYRKDSDGDKYLYAYEVTVTAVSATNVLCIIRPNDESTRDRTATDIFGNSFEKKVLKVFSVPLALKQGMGLKTEDRMLIAGGEKGTSLGGDVITDEMKKGTLIMPPQTFDLIDAQGKPVLREIPTANAKLN